MNITFTPFQEQHLPLWQQWVEKPHVKNVWFIEGYETVDYIYEKITGNGYDFPFIFSIDGQPIGYIVACDLYAYRTICPQPKGLFTKEPPGTFCMDLFIGDEANLDKGYGTKIVRAFIDYIFQHFKAQRILIDPAVSNTRAIHCYEKAGFKIIDKAFDGITDCFRMEIKKANFILNDESRQA